MKLFELNENDKKLLEFCNDAERSIGEIAKHLDIAPKNISVRLPKLVENDLIIVNPNGKGKRTEVRTKGGSKINKHFVTLLKEIEKQGSITEREYANILPADISDPKERDRWTAITTLPWLTPKLIEKRIFLTEEGKKFIKGNS